MEIERMHMHEIDGVPGECLRDEPFVQPLPLLTNSRIEHAFRPRGGEQRAAHLRTLCRKHERAVAGLGQSAIEDCYYLLRSANSIFSNVCKRISNTEDRKWHLLSGLSKPIKKVATQVPVVLNLRFRE